MRAPGAARRLARQEQGRGARPRLLLPPLARTERGYCRSGGGRPGSCRRSGWATRIDSFPRALGLLRGMAQSAASRAARPLGSPTGAITAGCAHHFSGIFQRRGLANGRGVICWTNPPDAGRYRNQHYQCRGSGFPTGQPRFRWIALDFRCRAYEQWLAKRNSNSSVFPEPRLEYLQPSARDSCCRADQSRDWANPWHERSPAALGGLL